MLTYTVEGPIVTVVGVGETPDATRRGFYEGLWSDPRVPDGALLLLDGRRTDPARNVRELETRVRIIAQHLGPKMGPLCAIIAPPRLVNDAVFFQAACGELGLRVGIFNDEPEARAWLLEVAAPRT